MESPLSAPEPGTLSIDIWSDVMCPFCCLGDRHLELALEQFERRDAVRVLYHSFLLAPELPEGETMPMIQMLAEHKGMSLEQIHEMHRPLIARGREVGIDYAMDDVISSSTRRAHELGHFAQARGRGPEMMRRLFRAHWSEGLNLDDVDVLVRLADEVGLDPEQARTALQERTWQRAVQDDLTVARSLGVQGVPFFVLDSRYAVSGAQPPEVLLAALRTAWAASAEGSEADDDGAEGAAGHRSAH